MTAIKESFTALALLSLFSINVAAQKSFKVGEVTTTPGEKRSGYILVPAGADSPEVKIPVTVINGSKEGPSLALIAGVHGYEYPPVLAMARLAKELDPKTLTGKVIIVHIANIPSFIKRTIYYNPYDWKNFNRVFPGKANGTSSERIAFQITGEVIDKCDYLIDNHCGDGNEDLMQYLYYTETGNPRVDSISKQLAINFNLKVIVHETGRTKDITNSLYLSNTALLRGKPSISIEAGKLGMTDEEDIIAIIRGSKNIMKYLKMVPGSPEIRFESVWVEEYKIITSEQDHALYFPLLSGGDHVQKGEEVGYLTDYFGNVLQKIYSPYSGIILYIIGTPPMSIGEPLVMIGRFGEENQELKGKVADKPLFRDPVYDGAADPAVIWNQQEKKWFLFYTNRRANVAGPDGVTWVHGTRIGIAESADGGSTWKYRDTCDIQYRLPGYTHWAPEVIENNGLYHMFLSYVPGVFTDWNHPRWILHLTSRNLINWKFESQLELSSDRCIDACVFRLPDGTWRMYYNNEKDGKSIYYADSPDLYKWTDSGKKVIGDRAGEGPNVFFWKDKHWMVVDNWKGCGIYSSDDMINWKRQPDNILQEPGRGIDDNVIGGHPDVVVSGERAYIFYFTHPGRSPENPDKSSYEMRRSSIQVAELEYVDGQVVCNRDKPVHINLTTPGKK